ncbi:YaaC-like Protein [Oceanobacillus limi]|uniref:YaaC-like Protein n=1 Tax=Oceanobacillus limi TaxID=930131 RepID=A0A1I0GUE9_9BACI|nr:YaaC family protein [Oceanobacillus limi]SET74804.1 YaaC-like Protein [Oceanobacillus limi]
MLHKEIDSLYVYLQSQQTAQKYLFECYKNIDGIDAETKSYQNCNVFMYYLDHGIQFYESGKKLDPLMQPILYFYGMVHLIKGLLLTKRPNYPESTTVLAHGVSARKRKKKNYTFIEDEVKVQHNGLFPYLSEHLYSIKRMPFEKITMKGLLSLIPELSHLFQFQQQQKLVKVGHVNSDSLIFSKNLLDTYHLTERAFIERIKPYLPNIDGVNSESLHVQVNLSSPFIDTVGPFFIHQDQSIYFPTERENFISITEVMVHYLLLYNLSMLSRYEAEWWGDLLHLKSEADYPFIYEFLKVTSNKIPYLIGSELYQSYDFSS